MSLSLSNCFKFQYILLIICLFSCKEKNDNHEPQDKISASLVDPHSFSSLSAARISHLDLDIKVDFEQHTISGMANFNILANGADTIYLDNKDLSIQEIRVDGHQTAFIIHSPKKYLGAAIAIPLTDSSRTLSIQYESSPTAEALQWLLPAQTMSKKMPFLYTQGQAILTRSWIPIQDSPGIRFTYSAKVRVPQGMLCLMSAVNPQAVDPTGTYTFSMKHPIPAYLMALAVGDLRFKALDKRSGIYAEPDMISAAATEFSETPGMINEAEKLFGNYIWDRYDILILPPAFPFGGMENPMLTFATPTVIAGDKSLSNLVAHELAHSWSGNLVTNATWNDFWLNEGFTVYLERRISEKVKGADYAAMSAMIGRGDLDVALKEFKDEPTLTQLKLDLKDKDPDDGMSDIAYEKGYLFLRLLEDTFGRDSLDHFINEWFKTYQFKPVTTEIFNAFLHSKFPSEKLNNLHVNDWLFMPGLPVNAPKGVNPLFDNVDKNAPNLLAGKSDIKYTDWDFNQWLYFLRSIDGKATYEQMVQLDKKYHFSSSGNYEISFQWLINNIHLKNDQVLPAVANFLNHVGRRKFVVPLYTALIENGKKDIAGNIYKASRANYHFVTVNTLDKILDYSTNQSK